ncbi:hypothetical protein Fot_48698 [Forsythia ovata]|uniref:Uncharacterized protein n=1 Tax=Forsythia ovata TaxID=205694 RepID=A0ABD1Q9U8_9LAMI
MTGKCLAAKNDSTCHCRCRHHHQIFSGESLNNKFEAHFWVNSSILSSNTGMFVLPVSSGSSCISRALIFSMARDLSSWLYAVEDDDAEALSFICSVEFHWSGFITPAHSRKQSLQN